MSFTFGMSYQPSYQKRSGICGICRQGIEAGAQIMVGKGYFHKHLFTNHNHYECWIKEVAVRAKDWFFAHEYKPTAMAPEKKAELSRLRAKRYYIRQKGGEPYEVSLKLVEIERRIALVKVE